MSQWRWSTALTLNFGRVWWRAAIGQPLPHTRPIGALTMSLCFFSPLYTDSRWWTPKLCSTRGFYKLSRWNRQTCHLLHFNIGSTSLWHFQEDLAEWVCLYVFPNRQRKCRTMEKACAGLYSKSGMTLIKLESKELWNTMRLVCVLHKIRKIHAPLGAKEIFLYPD